MGLDTIRRPFKHRTEAGGAWNIAWNFAWNVGKAAHCCAMMEAGFGTSASRERVMSRMEATAARAYRGPGNTRDAERADTRASAPPDA